MTDPDVRTTECRIIIADSHAEILRILSDILASEFPIVTAVEDGEKLIVEGERIHPTLIIADIRMPGLSGFRAWQQIRKSNPQCKIIFLSVDNDRAYRTAAIDAGAAGWVVKTSVPNELLAAVHCVLDGGTYLL